MRIPFDLIAAVLCVEGLGRYLTAEQFRYVHEHGCKQATVSPWVALAAWLGFLLFTWLLHELLVRVIEWRTRFSFRPTGPEGGLHPQVLYAWGQRLAQACTVLLFCAVLLFLRWPLAVDKWPEWFGLPENISLGHLPLAQSDTASAVLNLAPFLAAMLLSWLPRWRLARGFGRPTLSFRSYLANELRLALLLPLALWLVLSVAGDLFKVLPADALAWTKEPGIDLLGGLTLAFTAFALMPKLIIWLWQCSPLPEGELKARLQALLAASGVRARDILHWGPRNSGLLNACVLGPWSRYRYVLISPQLVDELGLEEAEAVLAHELGHARYGHLTLLFVMLLCMSALLVWLSMAMELAQVSPFVDTGASIAFVILYIWGFFGSIMRLCEREADLASAEIMGTPIPLIAALERLAAMSGHSRAVYSWHHGSISQRVTTLAQLAADPRAAAGLHARVRRVRWLMSAFTLLALSAQALRMLGILDFGF